MTVTVNPALFDGTITADLRGVATFAFAIPEDLTAGTVLTVTVDSVDSAEATTASLTVVATDGDTSADSDTSADGGTSTEPEAVALTTAGPGPTASAALPATGQSISMLLLLGLTTLVFGLALSRQPRRVRMDSR